jgi:hypothetical protein
MRTVADASEKNVDQFLDKMGITADSSLKKDQEILKKFGFPDGFLEYIDPGLRNKLAKGLADKCKIISKVDTEFLFLLSACYLVLFPQDGGGPENVKEPTALPGPVATKLLLALVVKGTDLVKLDLRDGSEIGHDEFNKLIEISSHFLCVSENEMSDIQKKLSIERDEIDRKSERSACVKIVFEHGGPLAKGKKFANKLELKDYLSGNIERFEFDEIGTLARVGGIGKLGFVRS